METGTRSLLLSPQLLIPIRKPSVVAAAYAGPGDVVSGAAAFWGLRAYTLASIGINCLRIIRASDSTEQDFTTVAGGGVDVASIATFLTSTTGKVKTFYDQTGNGLHVTNTTDAERPTFTLSGLGALPIITSSSNNLFCVYSAPTQPAWVSAVVQTTSTANQGYWGSGSNQVGFNGSNTAQLYAGTSLTATAATNSWHAIQSVMDGASSDCYVDGVATAGNAGTQSLGASIILGKDNFGNQFVGFYTEIGLWLTSPSSGQKSAMNANQHSYWGF
jgi:hypothetical protein